MAALALALAPAAPVTAQQPGAASGERTLSMPGLDLGLEMMEVREFVQRNTVDEFNVDYDFQFTDRRVGSGIDFQHEVVDDAGRHYKAVHYDHGNGVAVADIDGDGLLDIYFLTQLGSNELWKNLGQGRFADVTEVAGVGLADRISVTASFADVDNDGDPDLYVTTVRMGNFLFVNDGHGRFTDVTQEAGLEHVGHSSGAVFFDYDRDGNLDLFVTNVGVYTRDIQGAGGYYVGYEDAFSGHLMPERTERSILYRGLGDGRFEDVSEATGLMDESWSGDASFADVNRDGYPDLYVLNMQGDDHYYENVEGERFVDRTAETFPRTPWGAMGIKFFDYNNDGLPDLLLTDMHSDMSREVTPGYEKAKSLIKWSDENYLQGGANNVFGNALYENRGEEGFVEVSDPMGAENYWPWGLSTGDLNADGYQDVFIASSMNFPWRYGVNTVLLNNQGQRFLDSEFLLGIEPRDLPPKKPWFEVDCSGADRLHQLCRGRTGKFTVLGSRGTRSSVIFDIDGDGDLDIVTNEFHDWPQVLVSDLAQRREVHWLEVALEGRRSNRDGLGATVKVFAGGRTITQFQEGKSGYLSQSSMPLYFGLGEATEVDRIEVQWPSGIVQTVTEGIGVNGRVEIVEEAPPA